MLGLQSKKYLQATRALVAPAGESKDEATIYTLLCKASGVNLFGSVIAQKAMEAMMFVHGRKHGGERAIPQEFLLDLLLRVTGQMGFEKLLEHEHGWLSPDHVERSFLGQRVITDDGKVHLAPRILVDQAAKLEGDFESELANAHRLKLISKRAITTHNSWTHNFDEFVRGDNTTNYLYVHPDDAARLSLANGDVVDVTSRTGTVRLPMRLLADLMPGSVALPHGWGHQAARGLSVANKTTGVNVNILAADGPDELERVTGMAHLTGIPVDVRKASGPIDPTSWSGLSADAYGTA